MKMDQVNNYFTFHPPIGDQVRRYEQIRSHIGASARILTTLCPPSPELDIAIFKLREAVMWANAAIACNEKPRKVQDEA